MSSPTPLDTLRAAASAAEFHEHQAQAANNSQPTDRDLQIFKKVVIEHHTHAQVARRFDITRSRVTQIIKQVRLTLAQAAPSDPEITDHLARQRLETHLERQRLDHVLQIAARALGSQPKALSTTRTGHKTKAGDQEDWTETITKEQQSLNIQALKTYLRATEALGKLSQREPQERPDAEKHTQEELFHAISWVLRDWKRGLSQEPNRPNDAFIRMADHFQWCLFSWLYHRRQGTPAAEIILPPFTTGQAEAPAEPPAPDDANNSDDSDQISPQSLPTNHSPDAPNPANHPTPETNLDLTSDSSSDLDPSPCDDASSALLDSSSSALPPPSTSDKKSKKVSDSPNLKPETWNLKPPHPLNPYARMLLRDQKLDELRAAVRSGLPFLMEWDSELGPPPNLPHHLDDPGCQYTKPSKQDESEMVKDYLDKLRAEQLANA